MDVANAAIWLPHKTADDATRRRRLTAYRALVRTQAAHVSNGALRFASAADGKHPKVLMRLLLMFAAPQVSSLDAVPDVAALFADLCVAVVQRYPWHTDGGEPRAMTADDATDLVINYISANFDQDDGHDGHDGAAAFLQNLSGSVAEREKGRSEARSRRAAFADRVGAKWAQSFDALFADVLRGAGSSTNPCPAVCTHNTIYVCASENASPNLRNQVLLKVGQSQDASARIKTFPQVCILFEISADISPTQRREILHELDQYKARPYDGGSFDANKAYMKRKRAEMASEGADGVEWLERSVHAKFAAHNTNNLDPAFALAGAARGGPTASCGFRGMNFEKFLVDWGTFLDDFTAFLRRYRNVRVHGHATSFLGPSQEHSRVAVDVKNYFFQEFFPDGGGAAGSKGGVLPSATFSTSLPPIAPAGV